MQGSISENVKIREEDEKVDEIAQLDIQENMTGYKKSGHSGADITRP